MMDAVIFKDDYEVAVEKVAEPEIQHPNDVVVDSTTSCICGSDLHMYEGRTAAEPGIVFGHESMGVVSEIGDAVSTLEAGDRVVMPFNVSCGFCRNCEEGYTGFCTNVNPGFAGGAYGCVAMGPYPGGQAEKLRVPYADRNALTLPEGREHEDAFALLADIFPTGWHGTRLAEFRCRAGWSWPRSTATPPRSTSARATRSSRSLALTAARSTRASTRSRRRPHWRSNASAGSGPGSFHGRCVRPRIAMARLRDATVVPWTMSVEVSRRRAWVMAARPQTLPAAAAPVIVGVGLAVDAGVFAPLPALAALVGAALIQIGTNFANDYYDAIHGADTDDREGFTRVVASGLIEPSEVKRAMWLTFAAAIAVGTYLVAVGGLPILVVGLASVVAGIAYTGGPYPLGYHGLGDLFVFVFFGVIAVTGTYYVQAASVVTGAVPLWMPDGTVTAAAIVASLPVAALSTNILVVNNVRDREEDAETGKRTLAVRFGYRFARGQFLCLLAVAYLVPFWFLWAGHGIATLLPLITLPLAAAVTRTVLTETTGEALNPVLESTGKLLAAYAALFAAGLAV